MLNRKFTLQEHLLLGFFGALVLAGLYHHVVIGPLHLEIERNRQEEVAIEDQLEIQRYMSEKKDDMLSQLESLPEGYNGELGIYSNLKNEIKELDQVLEGALSYHLSFSQAEISNNMVQRDVFISYETQTYGQACDILEAIEEGTYRCLVKNVSFSRKNGKEQKTEGMETVYGNLLITFYETTEANEREDDWDREAEE